MRRLMLLAVATLLVVMADPASGRAQSYGYRYGPVVQVPQGVGCYWYRGRLNCNRYCYWEIDGHRYCTRHQREAESQAPMAYDYGPYAPDRRYRSAK